MKVGDKVKVHTDATSESVIVSIDGEEAVIDGPPRSVMCSANAVVPRRDSSLISEDACRLI